MGGLTVAAALVVLALLALVVWSAWIEPRRLVILRHDVHPTDWPAALDGLVVAVAADFHAGGPHVDAARVERVADRLAPARPDLVLWLGDYVDPDLPGGPTPSRGSIARALARLEAPRGAWAVLGNHDTAHGGGAMRTALEAEGIRVLENAAASAGPGLWVIGLADPRRAFPDLREALAEVPDDAALLGLLHDPRLFPWVPRRVALSFAGHTHGGQIDLPGVRRLVLGRTLSRFYSRGLIEIQGRLLLVTSGVGVSRLPVRLRRPPEAMLITLRADELESRG